MFHDIRSPKRCLVIGSLALCEIIFHQRDIILYVLVPAMLLFIHNTPISAFSTKCYKVLRWEIGGKDFPVYIILLPFTHDSMQEMSLNISEIQ